MLAPLPSEARDRPAPDTTPRLALAVVIRLGGAFLLSRALILAVAALSRLALPPGPWPARAASPSWLERLLVWDASWYLAIVKCGYNYDSHGGSTIGFYPLYPLSIRAVSALGLDPVLAGYLISHLALAGACVLLWKLAVLETRSASVADRAVTFLLFCPGAVWFGMVYTESVFLLTMLGCLLAARRERWLAAGGWGLAAALTRTPGVLLAGFLFLEAWQQRRELRRRAPTGEQSDDATRHPVGILWRQAVGVAGPVLGQLGFLIFQQVIFGDWRAQQKTVEVGWNTGGIQLPWNALVHQWHRNDTFQTALSDSLLCVVLAAAMVGFFTLRRVGYGVLVFTLALLYVSSTTGVALPRYLSTTVPVYLVLADLAEGAPLFEQAILLFSTATLTLLTALLVNGYGII